MIRRHGMVAALLMAVAPMVGGTLVAQQAVIFGEEPKLDPMRQTLKAELIVLRDSLAMVDATSARLARAQIGNSPAVVVASARALRSDCARGARSATIMQKQMAVVGTNDARGKSVISQYNTGLLQLQRAMLSCDKSLTSTLADTKREDNDPLFRVALAATEALKQYDVKLHVLLKTLQIPVDPRGFKSAIAM